MHAQKIKMKNKKAQTLPVVIIIFVLLTMFGIILINLLQFEVKSQVFSLESLKLQQIASIALEHSLNKLQQGSNWYALPITGFNNYDKEYITEDGTYKINIVAGNLFINEQTTRVRTGWRRWTTVTAYQRQGQTDFRTIGIKVKSKQSGRIKNFYAVVKKGYGGPLISKGKIDLPCPTTNFSRRHDAMDFFWGDVYSANPADGACKIPFIKVSQGYTRPQAWMPHVYARGNIYTAYDYGGDPNQISTRTMYKYGYTYKDMSPNAHCHPYSPFAVAPELDLDYFKKLAKEDGGYYGPISLTTGELNPYYVPGNELSLLTNNANIKRCIVDKLQSEDSVVFIDTTDALPLRAPSGGTANTYTGTTYVVSPQSISIYSNNAYQYYTRGYLFVMGPLILIGDRPNRGTRDNPCDDFPNYSNITRVTVPSNYYYPQRDDHQHFERSGRWFWRDRYYYRLTDVKHAGFLYVNGELRIGGRRLSASGCPNPRVSDICIYGTIYIDTFGSLTVDTVNDDPALYVYFDTDRNLFDYMGNNIILTAFGEWSWLVPTPGPY